ncbi:unnamed protein product [Parajaminaea phylloscopi]
MYRTTSRAESSGSSRSRSDRFDRSSTTREGAPYRPSRLSVVSNDLDHISTPAASSRFDRDYRTRPPAADWRGSGEPYRASGYGRPYSERDLSGRRHGDDYWERTRAGPLRDRQSHARSSSRQANGSHGSRSAALRDEGSRELDEAPVVDWTAIEDGARSEGFVVPKDIVDEFKRQGHFDTLRRSLLSTFQASSMKTQLLEQLTELLLSHIDGPSRPRSAIDGAALDALGDIRLQHAELMKFLESEERSPRGRPRRSVGSSDGQSEAMSGTRILDNLRRTLEATTQGTAKDSDIEVEQTSELGATLSPSGSVGLQVTERVKMLLGEELSHRKTRPTVSAETDNEEKSSEASTKDDAAGPVATPGEQNMDIDNEPSDDAVEADKTTETDRATVSVNNGTEETAG